MRHGWTELTDSLTKLLTQQAVDFSAFPTVTAVINIPAMFIVLPRFYGGALSQLFNLTQHAGLSEDVRDHRLNTRTVYLNPVFAFLYANMNYHIEHHMFPMVPFYRLPELHAMIKDDCPPAYPSLWAAWQEIVPALIRQRHEPAWYVLRELPAGAGRIDAVPAG